MHQHIFRFFTIGMASVAMLVVSGGGLLINGSFETGDLTGWNEAEPALSAPSVGAQDGDFAALLEQPGGVAELRQAFPANPGDEFNFSGYMLTENIIAAGDSFGLFKIVFQDADGNDLEPASISIGQAGPGANPGVESLPFVDSTTPVDTWTFSEAQGVAPANTTQVVFLALNIDFAGGSNPIWFDTIQANNTADGTDLLTNGNFETGDLTGWNAPDPDLGAPGVGAQDGSFAALLEDGGGVAELRQTFPANPGDEFNMSGYMLTENTIPAGPSFGLFKIVFKDVNGNDLEPASISIGQAGPGANPGIESLPFVDENTPVDTWTFSEAQGVAPANTTEVVFLALNVDFAGGVNPIWFDTIQANNTADGIDLLTNGNFETGDLSGWNGMGGGGGPATVGAPGVGAQDGVFAAVLEQEAGVAELRQQFPANPGDEFNLSGYMLTENAIPAGDSFGLFKIVFRDADGNDLEPDSVSIGQSGPVENPGVESLPFVDSSTPINTWTFSEAQGVAPANTVEVVFLGLNVDFAGGSNPIWFDNIQATLAGGAVTVTPDSLTVMPGVVNAGGLAELGDSDNQDLSIFRDPNGVSAVTQFVITGTSPTTSPTLFDFTLEGNCVSRPNVVQRIEMFNYVTMSYEIVDEQNANRTPNPDLTVTVSPAGDLSRFVNQTTNEIQVRVRYRADIARAQFASNTDQAIWTIQ